MSCPVPRPSTPTDRDAGTERLESLVDRVPEGWTLVHFDGRSYGLARTTRADGRSISVLARELGGPDLVSANIYRTKQGDRLRACEMPEPKVLDFLRGWRPVADARP